jgi:hypothetical protein
MFSKARWSSTWTTFSRQGRWLSQILHERSPMHLGLS